MYKLLHVRLSNNIPDVLTRVYTYVQIEVTHGSKTLLTIHTFVRPFPGVCAYMLDESGTLCKTALTCGALVRLDTRVDTFVYLKRINDITIKTINL